MRIGQAAGVIGASLLVVTGSTFGQDAGTSDASAIQEMARRLAEIEKQNGTLQTRVNELEAADAQTWLTQERADQIRGVVTDVLADSETRASLQSAGMNAGWDDGFFLQSPDGRFRLEVGGMVQARYMYSHIRKGFTADTPQPGQEFAAEDDVTSRKGWDIPHARLDFRGHVFGPDTRFRVQGEFSNQRPDAFQLYSNPPVAVAPEYGAANGNFQLLDAYIIQELGNGFAVRVGQFKLPFDRGWEVPIAYQLTGERDTVAVHMGLGRSQGVELAWGSDSVRVRGAFSDGANDRLFSGFAFSTTQPANSPYYFSQAEMAISARAEFKLAGQWRDFESMTSPPGEEFGLLLGVGAHWQRSQVLLNPTSYNRSPGADWNDWLAFTADVTANLGGATISASAYYHMVDSSSAYLYFGFAPVGGSNPTFDAGNVSMVGLSLYGSLYLSEDVEGYIGYDYMDVVSNGNLAELEANPPGANGIYGAFSDTSNYQGFTMGATWYLDGEDLKWGFSATFMPNSVSPAWVTPETGIRSTPVSDSYVLKTYVQLLF
ncbi:MAG: hypothetical protein P8J59_06740 [Phycisphaerales bacterium]|nr:hypothetical protein [Phycisphaerales bacterium]